MILVYSLVVFVLSVDTIWGAHYVGSPCTTNEDCQLSPYMPMSHCASGICTCDPGYIPFENRMCIPIEIGTSCPSDGTGDAFCQQGIVSSICHPDYHVCMCPPHHGFFTSWWYIHYECVYGFTPEEHAGCAACVETGGVCYDTNNDGSPDKCGCPRWRQASNYLNSMQSGCDEVYATPGLRCEQDNSIVCVDGNSICQHDGTLGSDSICTCPPGLVSIPDPYDPRTNYCVLDIMTDYDPNCLTCITNGGQCFDAHWDATMDGCLCPFPRVSPTNDPADACTIQLAAVDCTADSLVFCINDKAAFDHHIGEVGVIYTEGYLDNPNCHLQEEADGRWCLHLNHDSVEECGVVALDAEDWISYSVWILFQLHDLMESSFDVCMYGYCTYHKKAEVATGLVDVEAKKIRYSTGVSLKPVVDITTLNKFGEDLEEFGALLGEEVKVTLTITDDKGVFSSLRAEVCVASNMLSLNHPHAQSAVFILDGCPAHSAVLGGQNIVFVPDLADPKKIASNFFTMPKFSTDIVFFHCAVKVCLNLEDCLPEPCNKRRKRDVEFVRTKAGRRVRRSAYDVLQDRLESEDLMQKTVGIRINDPANHGRRLPSYSDINESLNAKADQKNEDEERIRQQRILEELKERRGQPKKRPIPQPSTSSTIVIFSTVGGCLVTMVVGLLVLICIQRRAAVPQKQVTPDA